MVNLVVKKVNLVNKKVNLSKKSKLSKEGDKPL